VVGLASRSKIDFVKALGADHGFDYGEAGWAAKVAEATGSQGVQVFLDSIGDLGSEAFPLLSPFGRWVIYGTREGTHNALLAEAALAFIGKNLSLSGFNLGANLHLVPHALQELFNSLTDGSLKVEVSKYPLSDARVAHSLIEERKTAGKLILVP
jgi:NADPH2:quinone reductase